MLSIPKKKSEATLFKHLEQFVEKIGAFKDKLQKVYKTIISCGVERHED